MGSWLKRKQFFSLLILLILFVALPLALYLVKQRQIIQKKATGVTPNIPLSVPVLQIAYYPPDPNNPEYLSYEETGWVSQKISEMKNATQKMVEKGLEVINDATRYHGYKEPSAPNFLSYSILDSKEFDEPIPRGHPLGEGAHRPNHGEILRDLNICDYVDNQGVKEVWMYGYHSAVIVPDESRMSSKYGDISNSYPKEQYISSEYRMPICNNSYVFYNFTYQPNAGIANNIHNRLHQIENVIFYAENRGYPPNPQNVKGSLFWDDFSEYVQDYTVRDYLSSCGNTHLTPNWINQHTDGYRYDLRNYRENNCETWHPDDSRTTYVNANCEQWGCTELGFYKWFMQNIPGFNNGIEYQDKRMRNWWDAMYDFNTFIDKGRSLYEGIPIPTPTPTPEPEKANLRFQIRFQGISGDKPVIIEVKGALKQNGEVKYQENIVVENDGNGVFLDMFRNIEPEAYTVFIKGPTHLQKNFGEVTFIAAQIVEKDWTGVELLTGDAVANNKIDIFDYNKLVEHFGPRMPTEGSPADFDLDGDVDIFDYNFLVGNFGKIGD